MSVHMSGFRALCISWIDWNFKCGVIWNVSDYVIDFCGPCGFYKTEWIIFDREMMESVLAIRFIGFQQLASMKGHVENTLFSSFHN